MAEVELAAGGSKSDLNVVLGGSSTAIRTYGDLVSSIVSPSHSVASRNRDWMTGRLSPMPDFNDSLTVGQLSDLVAFLEPHYRKFPVEWLITQ